MDYFKVAFKVDREAGEVLVAFLADAGFEMFEDIPGGVAAYLAAEDRDENAVRALVAEIPEIFIGAHWTVERIPDRNWNETWEKSFEPVEIAGRVVVRAPFHAPPAADLIDLVIEPKMSFGTGHHPTTALMIEAMLNLQLNGRSVLDLGCGSGVLAILAAKLGASDIRAIDIDDWAVDNTNENIRRNSCEFIRVEKGNALSIGDRSYDVILANINRNILLHDLSMYVSAMQKGSMLLMSGFFTDDKDILTEKATSLGLKAVSSLQSDRWMMLTFIN